MLRFVIRAWGVPKERSSYGGVWQRQPTARIRHEAAGALAFVKPNFTRVPGAASGAYNDQRRAQQTNKGAMAFVEVYVGDLDLDLNKAVPHLLFTLAPPNDDPYRKLYYTFFGPLRFESAFHSSGFGLPSLPRGTG